MTTAPPNVVVDLPTTPPAHRPIPVTPPTPAPAPAQAVPSRTLLSDLVTLADADDSTLRAHQSLTPVAPPTANDPGIAVVTEPDADDPPLNIDELLIYLIDHHGSDLHLTVGAQPMIRVHGDLTPVPGTPIFTASSLHGTLNRILTDKQQHRFATDLELDFAYAIPNVARFRVNVFIQQGNRAAVLRAIPWQIQTLEQLGIPDVVGTLADLPRGLVLVTGPTGSGKSTTLAAIIDRANRTRSDHIITIEDPIEYQHRHQQCIVNQREVGEDTTTFAEALKRALRQDPDIILVGEMRDLETISTALTAAETGHLVFGTLHTSSAASTIDRIIDVFPPEQQSQIRAQLASSLQAVVTQTLCKTTDGKGRVPATEIMMVTPAIRNLIREAKLQSIPNALQTGGKLHMHTLNQHLASLVTDQTITYEAAVEKTTDRAELNQLLGRPQDTD